MARVGRSGAAEVAPMPDGANPFSKEYLKLTLFEKANWRNNCNFPVPLGMLKSPSSKLSIFMLIRMNLPHAISRQSSVLKHGARLVAKDLSLHKPSTP